jgi:hypothetical protein
MTIKILLLLDPSQKNGPKLVFGPGTLFRRYAPWTFEIPMNLGFKWLLFGQLARCLEGVVALLAPFTRAYGSSMLSPSGGFLWAVITCIVHGSSTQVPTNECWLRPSSPLGRKLSFPLCYVYPLFRVFASPYTIYAEGLDHPEKKAVAFLDTCLRAFPLGTLQATSGEIT